MTKVTLSVAQERRDTVLFNQVTQGQMLHVLFAVGPAVTMHLFHFSTCCGFTATKSSLLYLISRKTKVSSLKCYKNQPVLICRDLTNVSCGC